MKYRVGDRIEMKDEKNNIVIGEIKSKHNIYGDNRYWVELNKNKGMSVEERNIIGLSTAVKPSTSTSGTQ
ncbi:MAG: hypothetical protein KAS32_15210 [Candidatus Peribacteraceae bacterium]|nr:hypothetical protein [Candidatus Peribacteraceae bacterium]